MFSLLYIFGVAPLSSHMFYTLLISPLYPMMIVWSHPMTQPMLEIDGEFKRSSHVNNSCPSKGLQAKGHESQGSMKQNKLNPLPTGSRRFKSLRIIEFKSHRVDHFVS